MSSSSITTHIYHIYTNHLIQIHADNIGIGQEHRLRLHLQQQRREALYDLRNSSRPYKPKYLNLSLAGMKYENLHARRSALKSRQLKRSISGRLLALIRLENIQKSSSNGSPLMKLPPYGQYYSVVDRKKKKKNYQKRKGRGGKYEGLVKRKKGDSLLE